MRKEYDLVADETVAPGMVARFDRGGYEHWGILGRVRGADGMLRVISANDEESRIDVRDFSALCEGRRWRLDGREWAAEVRFCVCLRAEARVGEAWPYNVLSHNCEHFVNQVVCGVDKSDQVRVAALGAAAGWALAPRVIGAVGGPWGRVAAAALSGFALLKVRNKVASVEAPKEGRLF